MDGCVEQPLAPTLGRLAVAGILWDIGDQAGIENALPMVRGLKATIEVEIGAPQVHPTLLGHLLQTFQALGQECHVRCIHGSHGDGSQHRAVVVDARDDFLPLLVFVARVRNPIAPFLATVLVPSPGSTLVSRCFSAARCVTLAIQACQSDPSSAHLAKTLYTVVE
jgi:hypothetical protein